MTEQSGYKPSRAERRAAKFKRGSRTQRYGAKPTIDYSPVVRLVKDRQQLAPQDYTGEFAGTRIKMLALLSGEGTVSDFDGVLMRLHMGRRRAVQIDPQLVAIFEDGLAAMADCRNRYESKGVFGFTGPGVGAVKYAVETLETIVEASTRAQMQACWDAACAAMRKAFDGGAHG